MNDYARTAVGCAVGTIIALLIVRGASGIGFNGEVAELVAMMLVATGALAGIYAGLGGRNEPTIRARGTGSEPDRTDVAACSLCGRSAPLDGNGVMLPHFYAPPVMCPGRRAI